MPHPAHASAEPLVFSSPSSISIVTERSAVLCQVPVLCLGGQPHLQAAS